MFSSYLHCDESMRCGFRYVHVIVPGENHEIRQCENKATLFYKYAPAGRYEQRVPGWIATCEVHKKPESERLGTEEEFSVALVVEG